MIENYITTTDGIVTQINKNAIKYDEEYISRVGGDKTEDGLSTKMSYLRLGFIIGSIGKIPHSILDIGYGDGNFLKVCKNIIPNCYGNDISSCPVPDGCIQIDDPIKNHYDVITFFDSLEHFKDIEFVKELNCNYICISVPNCHYLNDEWFLNWKHRKPDEHLWHFNEKSILKFMGRMGFQKLNCSNVEDTIRKNSTCNGMPNILSAIFKKI